jgi:hypothetical protein
MDVTGNVCWACGAALPPPTHGLQSPEDERLASTVRQLTIQIIKLQEVRTRAKQRLCRKPYLAYKRVSDLSLSISLSLSLSLSRTPSRAKASQVAAATAAEREHALDVERRQLFDTVTALGGRVDALVAQGECEKEAREQATKEREEQVTEQEEKARSPCPPWTLERVVEGSGGAAEDVDALGTGDFEELLRQLRVPALSFHILRGEQAASFAARKREEEDRAAAEAAGLEVGMYTERRDAGWCPELAWPLTPHTGAWVDRQLPDELPGSSDTNSPPPPPSSPKQLSGAGPGHAGGRAAGGQARGRAAGDRAAGERAGSERTRARATVRGGRPSTSSSKSSHGVARGRVGSALKPGPGSMVEGGEAETDLVKNRRRRAKTKDKDKCGGQKSHGGDGDTQRHVGGGENTIATNGDDSCGDNISMGEHEGGEGTESAAVVVDKWTCCGCTEKSSRYCRQGEGVEGNESSVGANTDIGGNTRNECMRGSTDLGEGIEGSEEGGGECEGEVPGKDGKVADTTVKKVGKQDGQKVESKSRKTDGTSKKKTKEGRKTGRKGGLSSAAASPSSSSSPQAGARNRSKTVSA